MSNAIVTKQGRPSKSGEKVDVDAAKVIPPSPEVKAEAAAREVATQKKETQKEVNAAAAKMTASPIKRGGVKKAVAIQAKKSTGNGSGPVARLTEEWTGKDGKDVLVKDRVRTAEGIVIDVIGRWTRKMKDGKLIPCVTGHIVSLPAGKNTTDDKSKGRTVGDRQNAIAAGCTHVKK